MLNAQATPDEEEARSGRVGEAGRAKPEYVNRIEAGRDDPTVSTLNSQAKAVGVPVTELLG